MLLKYRLGKTKFFGRVVDIANVDAETHKRKLFWVKPEIENGKLLTKNKAIVCISTENIIRRVK